MTTYYYIKYFCNGHNYYWHKNRRKWFEDRNRALPYNNLDAIRKCFDNPNHAIYYDCNKPDLSVVKVEVSDEETIKL